MSEEPDPAHKHRKYNVRFPSSVIKQARDLLWDYLDEQLKSEAHFRWSVATPDGEQIAVKSEEDFYFRHDDAVNANVSALHITRGFLLTLLDVVTVDDETEVEVQLPSRIHVDSLLELFAREERKSLASVPPTVNEEREKQPDVAQKPPTPKLKVFIGHGHDSQWKELKDFLNRVDALETVFYESSGTAGHLTAEVIRTKIVSAEMAFIVHTGEDEAKDGGMHARPNVVHEAGMSLNQFGSGRAIVLLEQGCTEYSNIKGTDQIRFPKGQIETKFGDVLQVILREFPGRL